MQGCTLYGKARSQQGFTMQQKAEAQANHATARHRMSQNRGEGGGVDIIRRLLGSDYSLKSLKRAEAGGIDGITWAAGQWSQSIYPPLQSSDCALS